MHFGRWFLACAVCALCCGRGAPTPHLDAIPPSTRSEGTPPTSILAAAQPAVAHAEFSGVWVGTVRGGEDSADIGFAFTPRGDSGRFDVSFSMPAMAVDRAGLGPAQFEGDDFVLPGLDTRLHRDGDRLVGTFAIPQLPVELRRAAQLPPAAPRPVFPAGPAPKWSVPLGAEIWGSPVVADDTVYVATAAGAVQARSAEDGSARWVWSGGTPCYGTPAIAGDALFLVNADSELVALDRTHGRLRWRRSLISRSDSGAAPAARNPTFNRRTPTPVAVDGVLYVGSPDGRVYAIAAKDGAVQWTVQIGAPIFGTLGVEGILLRGGALDGKVFTVDRRTHAVVTQTKLPRAVVSTPVATAGVTVVGCRDYLLYGLDADTLREKWRRSFWFSWVESTPVLVDGVMYIGGSDFARITAFDPESGQTKWQTRVFGLTWGTPIVTADAVYAATHAQREALIPHEAAIFALDRATGAVRWRIALAPDRRERSGVASSLAYDRGRLLAALFNGTLQMYRP